jgi:hypothetical protein
MTALGYGVAPPFSCGAGFSLPWMTEVIPTKVNIKKTKLLFQIQHEHHQTVRD